MSDIFVIDENNTPFLTFRYIVAFLIEGIPKSDAFIISRHVSKAYIDYTRKKLTMSIQQTSDLATADIINSIRYKAKFDATNNIQILCLNETGLIDSRIIVTEIECKSHTIEINSSKEEVVTHELIFKFETVQNESFIADGISVHIEDLNLF